MHNTIKQATRTPINRLTKLYSDQKLEMSALDVFKHSIAFVKGELLREMDKQGILSTTLKTQTVKENEIGWVLTVPAIWDFTAKQFMREAAKMVTIYIRWGRTGLKCLIIYHPPISQCSVPFRHSQGLLEMFHY
jgi:hypothetical protein